MLLSDVPELHYITPISNLASIVKLGILSHTRAAPLTPASVAMAEVQARRARIRVPDGSRTGRPLHAYANLYFHARNPMMFKRHAQHAELCVVCVRSEVMTLPGVIITDGNAGSEGYTRYARFPAGLAALDKDLVFAEYWTHPDYFERRRRGRIRCAEVLVPGQVSPDYIHAIRVSGAAAAARVGPTAGTLPVLLDPRLFFA